MEKVRIGQKEYTQEELYLIGKEHYPRYYYIFLYFGIIFFFPSLFVEFDMNLDSTNNLKDFLED